MTETTTTEEPEKQPSSIWREMGKVWTVLGILVAAASLSSLIQRWGDITLAESTAQVLDYYRSVADQVKLWLFDWWTVRIWPDWILPTWVFDMIAIWVLCGFSSFRGMRWQLHTMQEAIQRDAGVRLPPNRLPKRTARHLTIEYGYPIILGPILFALLLYESIRVLIGLSPTNNSAGRFYERISKKPRLNAAMHKGATIYAMTSVTPFVVTAIFFIWNGLAL